MHDSRVHARAHVTDRVDEAGSVVCRCMRCVRRRKCSRMDSCTSVGMSGDVWLIFTAASRKLREPTGSLAFSVAMVTGGCWGLGGSCSGRRSGLREEPEEQRVLAGRPAARRSFQETKARRPSKARPQTRKRPSRRPKVASGVPPPHREHKMAQDRGTDGERGQRHRDKLAGRGFTNGPVHHDTQNTLAKPASG